MAGGVRDVPKSVTKLSAASRKSEVAIALSLEASTGTSTKLFLRVSKKVPPGGIAAMIAIRYGSPKIEWLKL